MSVTTLDADLVTRICRDATAPSGTGTVLDVVTDPLDGSVWIRLSSWPRATEAQRALADFGLTATDPRDSRLHVIGWDTRLLRRRLGTVLAGIDDLKVEWDATVELASYHYDRRVDAGEDPDMADVLGDVETTMRRALPIPHIAPSGADADSLLELISAAEDAYERLITEHVDYAERALAKHVAGRRQGAA
jgi:hypothetical protein